jgi:hypothetical protein
VIPVPTMKEYFDALTGTGTVIPVECPDRVSVPFAPFLTGVGLGFLGAFALGLTMGLTNKKR